MSVLGRIHSHLAHLAAIAAIAQDTWCHRLWPDRQAMFQRPDMACSHEKCHKERPFGAWPCQLWSRPQAILREKIYCQYIYIEMSVCVWHWMAICHHRQSFIHVHENSFSFISLRHLRRRNNRCWCCNYGCLFNLVLVHLFLETRLRGSLGRCSLCRSVSQSSHASSRGSGFETHLFQALLLCSCFCSHQPS